MGNDDNSASMKKELKKLQAVNEQLQQHSKWINQSNHPELINIIAEYMDRDFWRLQEALNLLRGYHPNREGWGIPGDLAFVKSCIGPGGTLSVINPEAPIRKWQVSSKAFLKWVDQKGILRHADFICTASQHEKISDPSKKFQRTSNAVKSRQAERSSRLRDLLWMRFEIEQRTKNRNWDSTSIPATKADFHDVFFRIFPDRVKVKPETLADDLRQVNVKFQPGQKKNIDNVLAGIFKEYF